MKHTPLYCPPGLTESLLALFPDRVIPRGPITFLGPFTEDEVNQARKQIGLRRRKPYTGPRHRDGEYFAVMDLNSAPFDDLKDIFIAFLDEHKFLTPEPYEKR